jgi:hypothetical protein
LQKGSKGWGDRDGKSHKDDVSVREVLMQSFVIGTFNIQRWYASGLLQHLQM